MQKGSKPNNPSKYKVKKIETNINITNICENLKKKNCYQEIERYPRNNDTNYCCPKQKKKA